MPDPRAVLLVVDGFFCAIIGLVTAFTSPGHKRVGDMVAMPRLRITAE